jgi:hypothetical protein
MKREAKTATLAQPWESEVNAFPQGDMIAAPVMQGGSYVLR